MSDDDPADITIREWRELCEIAYSTKGTIQTWGGGLAVIGAVGIALLSYVALKLDRMGDAIDVATSTNAVQDSRLDRAEGQAAFTRADAQLLDSQECQRVREWADGRFERKKN